MELTLKRARRLEQQIAEKLREDQPNYMKTVSVMSDIEDIETTIAEENGTLNSSLEKRDELLQLRFLIRRAISETNEKSGINSAMTTRQYLIEKLRELECAIGSVRKEDWNLVVDQITLKRKRADNPGDYYSSNDIQQLIKVLDSNDKNNLSASIKDAKNQLQAIEDNLTILNNTNKVTLTDEHSSLLEEFDLV